MLVRATRRGYFGNILRDPGAEFVIPDELMEDKKRRPSWVERADEAALADEGPAGQGGPPPGSSAPGMNTTGGATVRVKRRGKKTAASGAELTQLPPVTVPDGTGITEGLGGQAPDWLPPPGDQT